MKSKKDKHRILVWVLYLVIGGLFGLICGGLIFMTVGLIIATILATKF